MIEVQKVCKNCGSGFLFPATFGLFFPARSGYLRPTRIAVRDDYRSQTWTMLIQECSNSGLTKREFCRRRGISEKSFYYWLRKLRSQMAEAAGPQIVQLESSVTSTEILQIHYRGAELKLPVGVDIEAVAALLRSIQSL